MTIFKRILLLSLILSFTPVISTFSQPVVQPFENAWYGFNLNTGGQTYFANSGRLADIDNDNDLDVLASRYFAGFMGSTSGFVVLKNNGAGFYNSAPVSYASASSSEFVYTAKLNNDDFEDVIVSNTGNNFNGTSITVYFNQGDGSFINSASYNTAGGPLGITSADFNSDGKADIAVACYGSFGNGNSVYVFMNTGDGTLSTPVSYPAGDGPYKLTSGKINSDNFPDLAIANITGKVNVLMNSGTGTFSDRTEYSFELSGSANYTTVCLGDVDHDTDNDIIYSNTGINFMGASSVGILTNNNGVFSSPVLIPGDWRAASIADIDVADLNADGWVDIVAASAYPRVIDGYQVFLNNGAGGFLTAYKNPAGQNTQDVMLGDVNNDHKIDIVTTDSYTMLVTVHQNPGDGLFPVSPNVDIGISIAGATDAADIDGDGDLDIIASASGRAAVGVPVRIIKNLGNGNFGEAFTHSIRGGEVQGKFRDLNGDHKPDILFATAINSAPYDFHYAINNGDGTFGAVQTKPIGSAGWYDIDAADMDNDGDLDVVLTEWLGTPPIPNSGRRIFICLNSGNAVFGTPIIKIVGPQPAPIGIADFNKDGKNDIATGTSGAMIDISFGMGNGDLEAPVSYSIGDQGGATDMVIEDFDHDGNLDIASSNFWEGTTMSVLFGKGDGTFRPAVIIRSAYSPELLNVSGITAGDLDHDGDKDIIVGNNASNCVSLYYNNNGTFEYKMTAGGYSSMFAPLFADFDNDGKGDVIAVGGLPPSGIGSNLVFMKGLNTGLTSIANNVTYNPDNFTLEQNYPNPFNPSTKIKFAIPASTKNEMANVKLVVYNTLGREVMTLVNEALPSGQHEVTFNGSSMASGVYFYKIYINSSTLNLSKTMKMILVK